MDIDIPGGEQLGLHHDPHPFRYLFKGNINRLCLQTGYYYRLSHGPWSRGGVNPTLI